MNETPLKEDQARKRPQNRKNFAVIHAHPVLVRTCPLPAFHPTNPLSFLQLAYVLVKEYLLTKSASHPNVYDAYYSPETRSIHVTDQSAARALWEQGFFGKGSLSRSEPEWLEREKRRLGVADEEGKTKTAAEVTQKRREDRKEEKRQRAKREAEDLEEKLKEEGKLKEVQVRIDSRVLNGCPTKQLNKELCNRSPKKLDGYHDIDGTQATFKATTLLKNQEHFQLTSEEAFFLSYGLGVLHIYPRPIENVSLNGHDPKNKLDKCEDQLSGPLDTIQLLSLFRRTSTFPPVPGSQSLAPDDKFMVNYAVYHHFRSLGWVVRPGIKFAVDFLLYAKGPAFHHAEFAVIVLPTYSHPNWTTDEKSEDDYVDSPTVKEHKVWKERGEWWWLHSVNRVQNQVMKTLILAYVDVPPVDTAFDPGKANLEYISNMNTAKEDIGKLLSHYKVSEFVIRRWSPKRARD